MGGYTCLWERERRWTEGRNVCVCVCGWCRECLNRCRALIWARNVSNLSCLCLLSDTMQQLLQSEIESSETEKIALLWTRLDKKLIGLAIKIIEYLAPRREQKAEIVDKCSCPLDNTICNFHNSSICTTIYYVRPVIYITSFFYWLELYSV